LRLGVLARDDLTAPRGAGVKLISHEDTGDQGDEVRGELRPIFVSFVASCGSVQPQDWKLPWIYLAQSREAAKKKDVNRAALGVSRALCVLASWREMI
jgi:hypothetical protein